MNIDIMAHLIDKSKSYTGDVLTVNLFMSESSSILTKTPKGGSYVGENQTAH